MTVYSNRGGSVDLAELIDDVTIIINGDGLLESVGGAVPDDSVTMGKLAEMAALTVIANGTNATANPTEIAFGTDGHVLRRSGTTLATGTLAAGAFADNTIALARLANAAGPGVVGKFATGAGAQTVLLASAGSDGQALMIQADGSIAWETPAGGGGSVDGSGAATRLAIWSDSDTLTSSADITYDDTGNVFTVAGRLAVGGTTALINASSAAVGAAGLEVRALSGNYASTYTVTTSTAGFAETVSYNSGHGGGSAIAMVACGNNGNVYGSFLGSATTEWQILRAYGVSAGLKIGTFSSSPVEIGAANVKLIELTTTGSVATGTQGGVATNATAGFLYVPTCAGTPTGTPATISGMSPLIVDSTNNKLYFYSSSAWRDVGP